MASRSAGDKEDDMRFVKEYASYKIKTFTGNALMNNDVRDEKIEEIRKIFRFYEKGLVTTDEAMKMIAEV